MGTPFLQYPDQIELASGARYAAALADTPMHGGSGIVTGKLITSNTIENDVRPTAISGMEYGINELLLFLKSGSIGSEYYA
ncbi:hypothetical protein J2R62_17370, partial [Plesiomonas shigelloides]